MFLSKPTELQYETNKYLKEIRDRFPSAALTYLQDDDAIVCTAVHSGGRLLHCYTHTAFRRQGYATSLIGSLIRLAIIDEAICHKHNQAGSVLLAKADFYPNGTFKFLVGDEYPNTHYTVWKLNPTAKVKDESPLHQTLKTLTEDSLTIASIE